MEGNEKKENKKEKKGINEKEKCKVLISKMVGRFTNQYRSE